MEIRGISAAISRLFGINSLTQKTAYLAQTDWGVNPSTGSDSAVGTNAAPLRTLTEYFRRVSWPSVINVAQVVQIQGDIPATDAARAHVALGPLGSVVFRGTGAGTLYTNAGAGFTASVARSAASNVAPSLADTLLGSTQVATFLATRGVRYRTTSGTNSGAITWPIKDLGSENARVGQATIPSLAGGAFGQSQKTVAVGDKFVVEQLTRIDNISLEVDLYDNGTRTNAIGFQDLCFVSSAQFKNTDSEGTGYMCFAGCDVGNATVQFGTVSFLNCQLGKRPSTTYVCSGGSFFIIGGVAVNGLNMICQEAIVDGGFISQGGSGIFPANVQVLYLGDVGAFDSVNSGIEFGSASCMNIEAVLGAQALFGSGNTKAGVRIHGGTVLPVNHSLPGGCTITGTSGDLLIGGTNGTAKTWASTPVILSDIAAGTGTTLSGIVVQ